jgi:acetyl-CoA carboxylase biotin carboxylase subunit
LPSPGTITHLRVPNGPYVRDDSGVYEGSEISVFYDPMISKLIVWGADRAEAFARMRRALDEYQVRGIRTNLPFHRRMFRHPQFAAGEYDTGFIDREKAILCVPGVADAEPLDIALAAVAIDAAPENGTQQRVVEGADSNGTAPRISPWRAGFSGWRRTE